MAINRTTLDKIRAQVLNEIRFARQYKQGKVQTWQKNEDLVYMRKVYSDDARANVELGRGEEYVSTLLSKIDDSITFKYTKRKDSQLKRVERLNSLKAIDQERDNWNEKDLAGKEQMIIYGRAIFSYFADSVYGYCPHLENVDVYDFLIDPSAGGIDIERAMYLGNYGVIKMKSDLKEGVRRGIYQRAETERCIAGSGNSTELNQEESNKRNREQAQGTVSGQRNIGNPDKFIFWRWFTTYEGVRYILLLEESSGAIIEIDEQNNRFASGLWPYWTYAKRPNLTEFWTPSPLDAVREVFYTQATNINQMLDNAEQINKPQRVVDVNALENPAELKYNKRNRTIRARGGVDASKVVQTLSVSSIDTPLMVFDKLESIQEKASGLTAGSKGTAEEEKVGIYEGNQANAADRFGLYNKSYSFGYKRFSKLYEHGVREHLTKRIAVDMIGPKGISQEKISRTDIFRKGEDFGILVESSNAEVALSETDKKNKLTFLSTNTQNPMQNQKKAYEISAGIAGFDEESIRQLMDNSDFGDAELMSEADKDMEDILDGKFLKPNSGATTAYKQRFVDYMIDNMDDMDEGQKARMVAYVDSLNDVIIANTVRMAGQKVLKMQLAAIEAQAMSGGLPPSPQEQTMTEDVTRVDEPQIMPE